MPTSKSLLHPPKAKMPKMNKAPKPHQAPRPRVKKERKETIASEMKQTHKRSTIEHSMYMDHKGRPVHRVEHHTHTTFESPMNKLVRTGGF